MYTAMVNWWAQWHTRLYEQGKCPMPGEREQAIRELVAEWMRHARSNLVIASMVAEEQIAPEILAFHAQQAVEKGLKALLVQRQVEFPRLHMIGPLLQLCLEAGYEGVEAQLEFVGVNRGQVRE